MLKNLKEIGVGKVFKVAGIEFIKFSEENGKAIAVAKECLFDSTFGNNNNFAESEILKRLNEEFLLKIEKEVGAENIVEHEVDLLSLDGSDKWGTIKTKISLPTFDFYRKHVKIFDKYKLKRWWWLSTPDTTSDHYSDIWVTCVSPFGYLFYINCGYDSFGVRPFLTFLSSISVSYEE